MTVRSNGRSLETPSRIRRGTLTLLVTRALRQVAFGCMAILLPIYWHEEGLSVAVIGFLFTLALLGSSTLTVLLAPYVDRIGRRRLLWFASALWTGTAFFLFSREPAWLAMLALFGSISPSGKEVGLFLSVEQTVLARLYAGQSQVNAYAWFNLIGYTSAAIGALVASAIGLAHVASGGLFIFHAAVIGYAAVGFIQLLLYTSLPIEVEAERPMPIDRVGGSAPDSAPSGISGKSNQYKPPHRTRRLVYTLSGLFMMDALGAGFIVQGLLVTWFQIKFGFDLTELGLIFFGTNLLSGLSSLVAARLAKTFGLLNTMVFTHLPSNLLLILVPLMPTPWLAVAVLLVRHLLSQMDVPTRQAYTMAIVKPADRAYMSAWTNGVRHYGTGMAPLFTGLMLALAASGLPFFIAGSLKAAYDLLLYVMFRRIPLEHFHQR
ncbi:MFS transporter [Alicyclobacillus tolerans]|uniref:MFS transporter n=1 Tax=Alicyclobacillus tolerans TaxID=90970 RepID=UPI001F029EF0|nr:MFS transporter [Alicyclobacillus tolerans]MCF8567422.1 MFS transporter [Alicyclobacillus tolerans]